MWLKMSPGFPRPDIFGVRAIRWRYGGIKTEGGSNGSLSISAAVKVAEEEDDDLTVSVSEKKQVFAVKVRRSLLRQNSSRRLFRVVPSLNVVTINLFAIDLSAAD